jgi:hypothetical protein
MESMRHARIAVALAATLAATVAFGTEAPAGIETHVEVRVLAHDAKLIGDAVGGARVTVTDAASGEVLASGVTAGKTGDTGLIIKSPHERYASILDTPGAAGFAATFRLTRPTLVEISAVGPLGYPQALARDSKTLLLEPGADIGGDGIVLDLHGLIVEVLDTTPVESGVEVRAKVRMLCSCPTGPDELWKIERVTARLMDGDEAVAEAPLAYSGETSVYAGAVRAPRPGAYTLEVAAADTDAANFGTVAVPVSVR